MQKQSIKIILFIVEGPSDKTYLYPITKLIQKKFKKAIKFQITHGDILTDKATTKDNAEIKIGLQIQNYIEETKILVDDIIQVIHIVDTDGAFIDPSNVFSNPSLEPNKTIYYRKKIENKCKYNIIKRNKIKSEILNDLYNKTSIKYGTLKELPYRVYYFSTNIDDYFFNKQNLTDEEKENNADLIYDRYEYSPDEYRDNLETEYSVNGDYIETWEYIKKDNNSLSRCTNFNKFFSDILDKIIYK